jgi:hypothetical protein
MKFAIRNLDLNVIFVLAAGFQAISVCAQTPADVYRNFEVDASLIVRSITQQTLSLERPHGNSNTSGRCSVQQADKQLDEIDRLVTRGDLDQAQAGGKMLAESAAACGLVVRGKPGYAALSEWAYFAGEGLAVEVQRQSPLMSQQTFDRALTYLKFATATNPANRRAASTLSKITPPKEVVAAPSGLFAKLDAKAVSSLLIANQLKFWTTYSGKTLQVTGSVIAVTGDASRAMLRLDGRPAGVTLDDATRLHYVFCDLRQPEEIAKAAELSKGSSVTIRGEVIKEAFGGVQLDKCAVR